MLGLLLVLITEIDPAAKPPPIAEVTPRTKAILAWLEEPVDMVLEMPLDVVLQGIKCASKKGPNDPGLPIYVDPLGLQRAGRTLTSPVTITTHFTSPRDRLERALTSLGMAYIVKDDVLIISDPRGIERERQEVAARACDASRASQVLIARLEEPVRIPFPNETPLENVLAYLQQRVKSFRFQWAEDHLQAKGSLVLPPDPQYKGVVFPPRDTTYRVDSSCEIYQHMMRYSFSGESLQVYNNGALEHREYVSASDGAVSKAFWPIPNKLRNYPKGVILDQKICSDAGTLDVKPLLWIYRSLDPTFAFSEESLQLSPGTVIVDGRTCTIVRYAKGETAYSIWTDRARDFMPLRFTIGSATTGEVTTQVDITYQRDPWHGWTPTGWGYRSR